MTRKKRSTSTSSAPGGAPKRHLQHEDDDDTDIEQQVVVTRIPVKAGDTLPHSKGGYVSDSSHLSLGDIDLISVPSFHSLTHRDGDDDDDDDDILEKEGTTPAKIKHSTFLWCKHTKRYIWYHPFVRAVRRRYRRVPTRYKYMCFVLWISWKFIAAFLLVYLVQSSSQFTSLDEGKNALHILYVVTRASLKQQSTATSWTESVNDLVIRGRHNVDVVLILGDESVDTAIENQWHQRLPPSTSLTIWADAIPWKNENGRLEPDVEALSMQHRSVMKDEWFKYDVFMQWDADTRITTTHVDYFWKQSQALSSVGGVLIPGLFSVGRTANETQSSEQGPFDAQICCNTRESNFVVNDATFLIKATSIQRRQDDVQKVLLPVSSENLPGWIMTQQQMGKLLQVCPMFLPTVENRPGHCSWQSWIDLDPDVFSNHFVEQSANVASSAFLSPNHLWKELGLKAIK